jgi:hypothetical protein
MVSFLYRRIKEHTQVLSKFVSRDEISPYFEYAEAKARNKGRIDSMTDMLTGTYQVEQPG